MRGDPNQREQDALHVRTPLTAPLNIGFVHVLSGRFQRVAEIMRRDLDRD